MPPGGLYKKEAGELKRRGCAAVGRDQRNGALSQGMLAAAMTWKKAREQILPNGLQKDCSPANMGSYDFQNCKKMNACHLS